MYNKEAGVLPADRTGFYLTVYDLFKPQAPALVRVIGEVPADKRSKYWFFSGEKPGRLILNRDKGHRSSWQSRNPDEDEWGGAALGETLAIGVSGLPELDDESVSLALLVAVSDLPEAQAQEIAAISNNQSYLPLTAAITRAGGSAAT